MNFLIGQKLVKKKEYGKALNIFLNLLKSEKENKYIYFYLGLIYSEFNNFNKSIINYKKYLKFDPNSKNGLLNLAIATQSIGEIQAAKDIYLKLINLDENIIRAYYGLLMLDINFLKGKHYSCIEQIKKNDGLSLYEKSLINFILARREKNNKNHKKEIEYLKKFNENSFNSNYAYNQTSQFYYEKIINNFFDKIKFKDSRKTLEQKNNLLPIFIIGLPRSGSTLIESILTSSDEKIKTCAESHVINISLLEQIGPKIFNKDFDMKEFEFKIDLIEFEQSVSNRYDKFEIINQDNGSFFIDKSLENFFNIEIILKIYPNAKFLHTFRDPADSVISIYQSMLPELSWTHKIEDILHYIDNYKKVINFFKIKYPKKIMDIDLEKFTYKSEEVGKEIYEFCGLLWDNKHLEFYKRKDLYSKTASFNQIRKKISAYDTKKYKPYINLLGEYEKRYKWINK